MVRPGQQDQAGRGGERGKGSKEKPMEVRQDDGRPERRIEQRLDRDGGAEGGSSGERIPLQTQSKGPAVVLACIPDSRRDTKLGATRLTTNVFAGPLPHSRFTIPSTTTSSPRQNPPGAASIRCCRQPGSSTRPPRLSTPQHPHPRSSWRTSCPTRP